MVNFEDVTEHELMQISDLMPCQREYKLSYEASTKLHSYLLECLNNNAGRRNFSNARMVRNLIERAIRLQAVRLLDLSHPSREDGRALTKIELREESLRKGVYQICDRS